MLSTNALSVFILHHHQNRICNKNLHSIKHIMRRSEMDAEKYKRFAMTSLIIPYSPIAPRQAESN